MDVVPTEMQMFLTYYLFLSEYQMSFQKSSSNVKEMMARKLLMSVCKGKLESVCLQECIYRIFLFNTK